MRQVFLDTETTGLSVAQGDRIIEIGCIEYINRCDTGRRLHHYVNPERAIHPKAMLVHGIADAQLVDKPTFAAIASDLVEFLKGADVVIHNAAFDTGFLDAEFARLKLPPLAKHVARVTDSLLVARQQFPGMANSLEALCTRLKLGHTNRDAHGALLDAGLLAEVYMRLTAGQVPRDAGSTPPPRLQSEPTLRPARSSTSRRVCLF